MDVIYERCTIRDTIHDLYDTPCSVRIRDGSYLDAIYVSIIFRQITWYRTFDETIPCKWSELPLVPSTQEFLLIRVYSPSPYVL